MQTPVQKFKGSRVQWVHSGSGFFPTLNFEH
jgi:hypothetical protein